MSDIHAPLDSLFVDTIVNKDHITCQSNGGYLVATHEYVLLGQEGSKEITTFTMDSFMQMLSHGISAGFFTVEDLEKAHNKIKALEETNEQTRH